MNEYPALSTAIEGFLLWKSASGLSHNTTSDYQVYLTLFARWANDPDLNLVTSKIIGCFFNYLQHEHKVGRGSILTDKNLSPKTAANTWVAFSVFWKWAVSNYGIQNLFTLPKNQGKTCANITLGLFLVDG